MKYNKYDLQTMFGKLEFGDELANYIYNLHSRLNNVENVLDEAEKSVINLKKIIKSLQKGKLDV